MDDKTIPFDAFTSVELDDLPFPMVVYQPDGLLIAMNRAAERLWGVPRTAYIGIYNLITDDDKPNRENIARVLAGDIVEPEPYYSNIGFGDIDQPQAIWLQPTFLPLRRNATHVTHILLMYRNVTLQIEQAHAIEAAQAEIARQRAAILDLSSPIIQVWDGILTVPLIGVIDAQRATLITERILTTIVRQQATTVILDLTAVPLVDTLVAQVLIATAQAIKLLGGDALLVGINSELAQTFVDLGIDLSHFVARANLQAGLLWAFAHRGLYVVARSS